MYLADKAKSGGMTSDSGTLVCNVRIRLSSRRVLGLRRRLSQEESRLRTRSQALPQGLNHLLQPDPLASTARRMATRRGIAACIWPTKPRVEV